MGAHAQPQSHMCAAENVKETAALESLPPRPAPPGPQARAAGRQWWPPCSGIQPTSPATSNRPTMTCTGWGERKGDRRQIRCRERALPGTQLLAMASYHQANTSGKGKPRWVQSKRRACRRRAPHLYDDQVDHNPGGEREGDRGGRIEREGRSQAAMRGRHTARGGARWPCPKGARAHHSSRTMCLLF
jgi:hypothetical protein